MSAKGKNNMEPHICYPMASRCFLAEMPTHNNRKFKLHKKRDKVIILFIQIRCLKFLYYKVFTSFKDF